jgi:hypothetical protein
MQQKGPNNAIRRENIARSGPVSVILLLACLHRDSLIAVRTNEFSDPGGIADG